ncbi:hypothetical protein LOTGIDRAFT_156957 [Lottia gigantea]|uniref:C2H2-type domain-containing protein n=1 Tax=Lottia gigantea TaxID=225164 RepID=V4AG30_LOTGI|nr:hypothetical protein LOTGIDRAFT_156957 [Lottia gigantea]ESP02999.1 hypothetical protein LOTGIDRAFT_156957 [Lottia gigantea]
MTTNCSIARSTFPTDTDTESDQGDSSSSDPPSNSETIATFEDAFSCDKSWAPTPATARSEIGILNAFLKTFGREPIRGQLKKPIEDIAPSTMRYYKNKTHDTISIVLNLIAPNQEEKLMDIVMKSEKTGIDSDDRLLEQLVNCYNRASSWQTKRQILSISVQNHTKSALLDLIPGLTKYRIDQARKHAMEAGHAQPVESHPVIRKRLDDTKVDHFLDFISRPEYTQDVAYGTKNMKLSHGEKLEIPNVVRTVIASRLIDLYKSYCQEIDFEPLGRTIMYNILQVCAASKKVSLAVEGTEGFSTLRQISKTLSELGLSTAWLDEITKSLASTELYFKTDMKLNLSVSSQCISHCITYALSEQECDHEHTTSCSNCEKIHSVLEKIESGYSAAQLKFSYEGQKEELIYDFQNAKSAVLNYRAHIVRAINQERAKNDILNRRDNAGCYHCAPLILSMAALAKRQNVTITAYDFSEAQAGKDTCDRKIASLKAHIQRYINDGHNVTTASEMFDACRSYNGVRGCCVSVMNIDETVISERVTWTGITTMTNFTYEENGVRVWKAFGIGKGVLHSYDKLLRNNECNVRPMFTMGEYSTPQISTGAVHRTTETLFSCSEEGCSKLFRTENELTRHLSVGRHERTPVLDTKFDSIKRKWQGRVAEVAAQKKVLYTVSASASTSTKSVVSSCPDLPMGWALKITTKRST